jgi:hypothetical protein
MVLNPFVESIESVILILKGGVGEAEFPAFWFGLIAY